MTQRVLALTITSLLLVVPVAAEADRAPRIPRIGVVYAQPFSVERFRALPVIKALLEGLEELNWVEGRDFVLDARSAKRELDRVPDLVAALLTQNVDLMLSLTCGESFHIVRKATSTIPIVIGPYCKSDLVGKGIVASLARPGGNITGISEFTPELSAKRLSLLKEAVPTLSRVVVLECGSGDLEPEWQELRAEAAALAVTLHSVQVGSPAVLQPILPHLIAREKADGLLGLSERPECFARLPAMTRLPDIYASREVLEVGGLMSYGPNLLQRSRRVATYVAKLLAGATPADLPIEQATKFELVVNLRVAKALNLTIPPSVLARADEVIHQ
jgi:putative tryptophan/tyrosine transport system substrate-binding protein